MRRLPAGAAGLVVLALLPACSIGDAPAAGPTAPAAAGCPDDPVEAAVCRLVTAVQADDTGGLSPEEQQVAAAAQGEVPGGDWTPACELVGDVTVLCEVDFADAPDRLGFHVAPVNAQYDDGALTTPNGEAVRYQVVEYLGTGTAGS